MTASLALLLIAFAQTKSPAQTVDLRCGGYCLYVSLKGLDFPVANYDELEKKLGQPTKAGYSMAQLEKIAKEYGAQTLGVQTSVENLLLRPGRFACIALIEGNHFVNLAAIEEGTMSIIDAPRSNSVPLVTLSSIWDGKALLISPDPLLAEEDLPMPFPWMTLWMVIGAIAVTTSGWFAWKTVRGDS